MYLFNDVTFRTQHDFTNSGDVYFDMDFGSGPLGNTQFLVAGTLFNTGGFGFGDLINLLPQLTLEAEVIHA